MNVLFQAGSEVQRIMQSKKWPFCFIGGLAVIRWGEIRMTQDINVSLLTGFDREENYIDSLLSIFTPRISNAKEFALSNRVLLLFASNGVAIDISLAGLPFERSKIERSTSFEYTPDCILTTCSAEDLIFLKAFAD